ncbi:S41 family peptidase [Paenibacillus sp. chi10]|uniref:S41 family peptidase n=1 Tax=Paenibacillus suaedae TaxID=3077233 RepID=A0AAJ2N425_9BACL|nr:S41 family peptidase [Paenibacillus sp. chi10]MDT8976336.1 S41 family peptidase [Paenibacillus sp. chi10]
MSFYGTIDSIKWFTVWDLILSALNLFVLIWYAVPIQKYYRWLDFVPSITLLGAVISILDGDTSDLSLLIYSWTFLVFICTIKKIFKPSRRILVPKYRIWRIIVCIVGVIPFVAALMFAGQLRYNPVSDLSSLSYSQAFVKMNERLSVEYPFSDWKKINWDALRSKFEPIFQKAEKNQDKALYYQTLKEYVSSIPDGHVGLKENKAELKAEIGGGFGITAIRLDDGTIFVNKVIKDSPAEQIGIKVGAEIVTWDGRDAQEAYNNSGFIVTSLATEQAKMHHQGLLMTRAPIGKEVQVAFINLNETKTQKVTLQAYDDNFLTLQRDNAGQDIIEGQLLSSGYGYLKINSFQKDLFSTSPEEILTSKLQAYLDHQMKGLIIDVRDNRGGEDQLVADIARHFVQEERFYEITSYYNRYTHKFELNHNETRTLTPTEPSFNGKIAILINSQTVSSGEGIPLALKGLPNVKIIGFTPTNGSFGLYTAPITIQLPEGYVVQLPDGRSLNRNHEIQVDSDFSGKGGVTPDIQIPLTRETFKAKYVDSIDVELEYAIKALQ